MKKFGKPKQFEANVIVIGAGSAGLVSSIIASGAQAKVILIEKDKMGGDCLNTGCVPSKALIRSSRMISDFRRADQFGIENFSGEINFTKVMERVRAVIETIAPHDSVARYTSLGVECIKGEAKIESPFLVSVDGRNITTRSIILATGASPLVPDIPGIQNIRYLTSDTVWGLSELPRRFLVIGGGPIGCEIAQAFANLGSAVTQIDSAPRIMAREDSEVSSLLQDQFTEDGISVLTNHKVVEFGRNEEQNYAILKNEEQTTRIEFDEVLIAVGRVANTSGFGLENLDLPLTSNGNIAVNAALQTGYPNIFACGDVAGPHQFTHMASYQAFFASLNALLGGFWRVKASDYIVPSATFTSPEIARAGLNEQQADSLEIDCDITFFDMAELDRAVADGIPGGFIKILTSPKKDTILGVTIVGPQAGELIGEFIFAMTHGMGLKKISAVTHIYPTLSEANKFAANKWRNDRLPTTYFPILKNFFRWRRG